LIDVSVAWDVEKFKQQEIPVVRRIIWSTFQLFDNVVFSKHKSIKIV